MSETLLQVLLSKHGLAVGPDPHTHSPHLFAMTSSGADCPCLLPLDLPRNLFGLVMGGQTSLSQVHSHPHAPAVNLRTVHGYLAGPRRTELPRPIPGLQGGAGPPSLAKPVRKTLGLHL